MKRYSSPPEPQTEARLQRVLRSGDWYLPETTAQVEANDDPAAEASPLPSQLLNPMAALDGVPNRFRRRLAAQDPTTATIASVSDEHPSQAALGGPGVAAFTTRGPVEFNASREGGAVTIILVHLSDLHCTGDADPFIDRAESIATAVASTDDNAVHCIIVFTGDIANTGQPHEYDGAAQLVERISKELKRRLARADRAPIGFTVVALPGNHDCDLTGSLTPRELILKGVRADQSTALDPGVQNVCTVPQAPFREFLARLTQAGLSATPVNAEPLRNQVDVRGDSWGIRINCYNSAWCSQRRESPGTLIFPHALTFDNSDMDLIVISALHHPFNWFEPTNARAFYAALTASSDVILTGHEHSSTSRAIVSSTGAQFRHSEAPALRDATSSDSGFHVYVVDPKQRLHRLYDFQLVGDRYEPVQSDGGTAPAATPAWESFLLNKLRAKGQFTMSAAHLKYLDDIGVTLVHRDVGQLRLPDIFVFPDLREITLKPKVIGKTVPGSRCRDFLRGSEALLITGESSSGKTALAKSLCLSLYHDHDVPVLLSPTGRLPRGSKLVAAIESAFLEQYSTTDIVGFRQLDRSRRVIIVDDVHRGTASGGERARLLTELRSLTDRIVFLADDLSIDLEDLTEPGGQKIPQYRIQPFGYLHRNDLVEKWLSLTNDDDAVQLARKTTEVTRRIDDVVGRGYIPAYPAYVLAVLQAADSAVPFDSSASTHGHYYEIFIRTALLKGSPKQRQIDVLMGYLAYVAYAMFKAGKTILSLDEVSAIQKRFEERVAIGLNNDAIVADLISKHILNRTNDHVTFSYKYIYYYFVASYLRDNIAESDIRTDITALCNSTQRKENADILLFLAHLSKDPFIVSELTRAAQQHYKDVPEIRLDADVDFLRQLADASDDVTYEEKDVRESRRELAVARDEALRADDDHFDGIEVVARLSSALRTLQILGQILKNYPGHLQADTKLALARSGFGVGARSWSWILKLMQDNQIDLAKDLVEFFQRAEPDVRMQTLAARARDTMLALARLCSFGVVRRISEALGAPELSATYKRLAEEVDSDAVRVVLAAIALAHSPVTPEAETLSTFEKLKGNQPARWLLRQLVLEHFALFPVDMRTKQRLCAKMDIAYKSGLGAKQDRKLLKGRDS